MNDISSFVSLSLGPVSRLFLPVDQGGWTRIGPPIGWKRDRVKDNCLAAKKREEERGATWTRLNDIGTSRELRAIKAAGHLVNWFSTTRVLRWLNIFPWFLSFFFFFFKLEALITLSSFRTRHRDLHWWCASSEFTV